MTAVFYWSPNTGSGNVVWALQGRSYGDSDAIDQAFGTQQTVTDNQITLDDVHISAATPAITITGAGASEMVQFRAYRNGTSGSDTHSATVRLIGIMVTFTRS